MYKFLLCWRYLRTRYIALASIISVMLGVATMIIVNAVMAGFSHEMEDRMHDVLSDVVLEGRDIKGFPNPADHMQAIQNFAGQYIAGMTPTVHVPALLNFQTRGGGQTQRQIVLIGIDEKTYASVSDIGQYLQHPANREQLSFEELRDGGYDDHDHLFPKDKAPPRPDLPNAGWPLRKWNAQRRKAWQSTTQMMNAPGGPGQESAVGSQNVASGNTESIGETKTGADSAAGGPSQTAGLPTGVADPFKEHATAEPMKEFDPETEIFPGVVLGIALSSVRDHEGNDRFLVQPGDDVTIMVPTAGDVPKPNRGMFTVVDLYESKMSEYDSTFVFAPIKELQRLTGVGDAATSIQIKLKPGVNGDMVRDILRSKFPSEIYGVYTWRDKQGPLLAAVQMERAVLNILLFMIIAVAGFGILAIFFMIVVEKTRDVGILKSLGASSRGIMGIFLGYGLSLGFVGAGVGMAIGLLFVHYINQVRAALEWAMGQPVFDPSIYYFYEIPTIIDPFTITWIVFGALSIAVLASVMPALRAARLHPVEALRYE